MPREVVVIGAPSSLGIRPYDDGEARYVDRAPDVLRQRGLIPRLGAADLGDVVPPPYQDFVRPPARPRNESPVVAYSQVLARRVAAATAPGRFALVLGGDCSIVLGCLLGARRTASPLGLAYVDAHADFAVAPESAGGSIAGMALALAVGLGDTPLARLGGRVPLVDPRHVALVGRRVEADAAEREALASSAVLDLPHSDTLPKDFDYLAAAALTRVAASTTGGFWIQVDAHVLDPVVMPAVDSPATGGLMPAELISLLAPLVRHPGAVGLSVTLYDPALDPDRSCARRLVGLLEAVLAPVPVRAGSPPRASVFGC